MKQVAKLVIIDDQGKHLMLYRNAHPTLGDDPDIPGGTLEDGELPLEAMIREVYEEARIEIAEQTARQIYESTDYSAHKTSYVLYAVTLEARPTVTMSWEHTAYEWLDREAFLEKAKSANDTYMHMVYDALKAT
jgi:8-oxo-dGTP pyrophosphatase MutT (NUDIX family)